MIRDEFLAFDDEIRGTGPNYTSDTLMTRLAAYDQMAVALDVRSATIAGPVTITAALEHSGDGQHFVAKYLNGAANTVLVIWVASYYPGAASGYDDGTYPGLPFMRISIQGNNGSGGTFTSARVKLYVTLRDIGGGKPFSVKKGYR